jgi:hypothetical protein
MYVDDIVVARRNKEDHIADLHLLWLPVDHLDEELGLSTHCPNHSTVVAGLSVWRWTRSLHRWSDRVCPLVSSFLLGIFSVSPPSGVFSATTSLERTLLSSLRTRGLLMTTIFPLFLSTAFGQTKILFSFRTIMLIGKGCLLICISWKLN